MPLRTSDPVSKASTWTHPYLRDRHSLSTIRLSIQRPRPSMEFESRQLGTLRLCQSMIVTR